ncbi:MAG: carbohydrate binding domain-containing protein [Elusimicrobiota bacterium]
MKKAALLSLSVLFCCFRPAAAADLHLIDASEMNAFETGRSTYATITEEFEEFSEDGEWLEYDKPLWKSIKGQKEDGFFEVPYVDMSDFDEHKSTTTGRYADMYLPPAQVELPYQTRLSISGNKSISIRYGNVYYFGDEDERTVKGTPAGTTKGFEMEQELKVRIKGNVGEKITVNVDYDDTKPVYDENARKISILYKGDEEEVVQEAAFGDITLSIPSTKFVGYSKKVFGASVKGKYKDFSFMAIGSQTKGKTEEKEFMGQTTFSKKDIKDISYMRRKYYSIDLGTQSTHLPIEAGSVNIYIDDQDISNIVENNESTMTVTYFGSTQTYTGYFYKLVAGRDFYVDHINGILTFNETIQSNYVTAVEYKYNSNSSEIGGSSGYPVIIKDETETLNYELKNRYSLGARKIMRDDFVIKFLDLSRNEVELPAGSYLIDYELGYLNFTGKTPFYDSTKTAGYGNGGYPDTYNKNNPQHHYIIYVEYKEKVKSYFLRPNIVRGSDRILLDNTALVRDRDYILDYPSGFLTFLNEEKINETTKIEVTYEYMPFGGLFKETLVGLRGEYDFSSNFSAGSTLLYNWASAPLEIPTVHSTPVSTLILETDATWKIPESRYFPLPTSVNGEVAQSIYNPNTLGKAMIDNMEGVRESYSVPTVADNWRIAVTPSGMAADPGWITLSEEDVYMSDINNKVSETDDEKKNVLDISYNLPSGSVRERSVVYAISKDGLDFSEKDTIQMWLYGDGKGAEIQIDFGSISEDVDGSGKMKSEDINTNGTLDRGEDVGWSYLYNGSTYPIGAANGEIDTNDLDGDGYLDTIQNYKSFDSVICTDLDVDWTGWKNVTIERDKAGGTDADWSAVKHVRITVKGTGISGTIGLAALEVVGNKWEVGQGTSTLSVNAVNNYDNDEYISPRDTDMYDEIYKKVGGNSSEKEQALELAYSELKDGTTVYAYYKYSQAVDLSHHNKLSFLLYGGGEGVDFIISMGSGDSFFTKKIRDDFIGWRKFTFDMPSGFEKTGSPSLSNIMEIRLSIANDTGIDKSGKLWVNEIYVEDPEKRIGHAWRGSFSSSLPGILSFGGDYQTVDRDFQTITTTPKNQDNTTYSANAKLTALKYLPVTGSYSESNITTPPDRITPSQRNSYLREEDAGEVTKKTGKVGATFSMRRLPTVKGDYTRSTDDSNFTGKNETSETVNGSASYSVPLKFYIIPRTVGGSYRKTDSYTRWKDYRRTENPDGGYENTDDETLEYSGNTDIQVFSFLILKPRYSKNEKYKTRHYYSGQYKYEQKKDPWSMDQDVSVDSQMTIMKWLRPNASYSIKTNEDYDYSTSGNLTFLSGTKDIGRNFSFKAGVGLPVTNVLPWIEPVKTLNLNANIGLEKGETYQDVENDFYIFDKLDQNYELEFSSPSAGLTALSSRKSEKYTANWSPFNFLNLDKGLLAMIGGLSSRSSYDHIDSRKEITGTVFDTITEVWPDIKIDYGKVERIPYTKSVFTEIRLRTDYSFKKMISYSNSAGVDRDLGVDYGANCRFLMFKKFDSLFEHNRNWEKKIDLKEEHWITYQNSLAYSGQVKIVLKKYWNLIARYSQKKVRKIAYEIQDPLTDTNVYTPSLQFDAIIDMPATIRIPLIGKELAMMNRLKVTSTLQAEFSRSDIDVDKTNTNKYLMSTSADMDVSSNMRLNVKFGGQYLDNIVKYENGYFSFYAQSEMVIRF